MLDARRAPAEPAQYVHQPSADMQRGFRFPCEPGVRFSDLLHAVANMIEHAEKTGRIDQQPKSAILIIGLREGGLGLEATFAHREDAW